MSVLAAKNPLLVTEMPSEQIESSIAEGVARGVPPALAREMVMASVIDAAARSVQALRRHFPEEPAFRQ
jgi:hypothetical protein